MSLEKMIDERVKPEYYFDLNKLEYNIFKDKEFVWDALKGLDEYLKRHLKPENHGKVMKGAYVADDVFIGKGTIVRPNAVIEGPTIIGENCEVRPNAYFRGSVLVGNKAVLGGEFKNSILFNEADVPHGSYVGDSIIGYQTNLAAGVMTSPHNFNWTPLIVDLEEGKKYETGMVKFGSIIGDKVTISCNCTLSPASLIGRDTIIYPNIFWRGFCPKESIVKLEQQHTVVKRDMSRLVYREDYKKKKKHLYQ